MNKSWWCSFATLGFIGRFYGSGTVATVVTLPIVCLLSSFSVIGYGAALLITLLFAFKASSEAITYYRKHDPQEVVIDEVVGTLITFIGIPMSLYSLVGGFLLFRFFDISKCLGIRKFGNLRGAWGVLLDDCVAGILSNLLMQAIFLLIEGDLFTWSATW